MQAKLAVHVQRDQLQPQHGLAILVGNLLKWGIVGRPGLGLLLLDLSESRRRGLADGRHFFGHLAGRQVVGFVVRVLHRQRQRLFLGLPVVLPGLMQFLQRLPLGGVRVRLD